METAPQAQVAEDILSYLAENSSASDTLDGIVRWWMFEQKVRRETEIVRGAVRKLVDQGILLERIGINSQIHYRLNPEKLEEVRAFLSARSQR